jgi:hypothetical protein
MLESLSQQRLQARLASAIEKLYESYTAEPEMAALAIVPIDHTLHLRALQPYFSNIQAAEQTLVEREIPDGVLASMWRGAANAFTDPTAATAGMANFGSPVTESGSSTGRPAYCAAMGAGLELVVLFFE